MEEQQLIDIPKVLASKNPRLAKLLPRFAVRSVERILHVKEVNHILSTYGHLDGVEFANEALKDLGISYTIHNESLIPANDGKRYIFVSNHPLGGLDGMVLMSAIGAHFDNRIKFIVNDLLLNLKPLESVFVPVNKHGRQSGDYVDKIDQTYQSDDQVLYFPAGLCSRKIKGKIVDLDWKKSVVSKAVKYERDIVPIFYVGRNSNFFYNLANLRKRLGIKANIEMFFLSHELFRLRNTHFDLVVGEPIPYTTFGKEKSHQQWAAYLKEKVYSMEPPKK